MTENLFDIFLRSFITEGGRKDKPWDSSVHGQWPVRNHSWLVWSWWCRICFPNWETLPQMPQTTSWYLKQYENCFCVFSVFLRLQKFTWLRKCHRGIKNVLNYISNNRAFRVIVIRNSSSSNPLKYQMGKIELAVLKVDCYTYHIMINQMIIIQATYYIMI